MSKLVRYFIPGIVVVGLVAVVPPYINGYFIEKDMMSIQNKMPANSGITLQVKNYHRGWFSSQAKLVMHFANNADVKKDTGSITLDNTIYHGPFIFLPHATETTPRFAIAKAYVISSVDQPVQVPLTIQTNIAFGDKVYAFANADKITYQLKGAEKGTSLIFQGLQFKQTSSHKFKQVSTQVKMAAFDVFDKDQGHLKIKNISHTSNFNEESNNFWIGSGETRIAYFDLQTAKNAHFAVQNFKFLQSSEQKHGRGFGKMSATIDEVTWNDQNYGKQAVEVSARNFDPQSLKQFTDALEENQAKHLPLLPFGKPFRAGLQFLSKGIELSLDRFDVNTTWGRIKADAKMILPPSKTNLGTLEEVTEKLTAFANITVPEPIATNVLLGYMIESTPKEKQADIKPETAKAQLQSYVDNGWIVKTPENNYKINIKIEKGQVYLNNKPFEMPNQKPVSNITNNGQPATTPTQLPNNAKPAE